MTKVQSTQNHKTRAISPKLILMAIVAILLFSLLLSSVIGLMNKYIAMRKHITNLKQEQVALESKKDAVTTMNDYIDTPEGQERVFRDKYRLVKPGEGMIVVTNDEIPTGSIPSKKPVIKRFWDSIVKGLGL
jgi:cell division protein FtsB